MIYWRWTLGRGLRHRPDGGAGNSTAPQYRTRSAPAASGMPGKGWASQNDGRWAKA